MTKEQLIKQIELKVRQIKNSTDDEITKIQISALSELVETLVVFGLRG